MERIQPITWNTEAFDKLVLPSNRKEVLQTLIEAHTRDLGFDDFIKGKGQGLVINLFGNPGVGKTLTAEAISDIIQAPYVFTASLNACRRLIPFVTRLYVVGAGDLGITAFELNERCIYTNTHA